MVYLTKPEGAGSRGLSGRQGEARRWTTFTCYHRQLNVLEEGARPLVEDAAFSMPWYELHPHRRHMQAAIKVALAFCLPSSLGLTHVRGREAARTMAAQAHQAMAGRPWTLR